MRRVDWGYVLALYGAFVFGLCLLAIAAQVLHLEGWL